MQRPSRLWWLVLITSIAVIIGLGTITNLGSVKWVGRKDLEVQFIVLDSESNEPLSNAKIHILQERSGPCEDQTQRRFEFVTDGNGSVKHMCKDCMCFGSRSTFEDTFASHVPAWRFHATADGYEDSQREDLENLEFAKRVKRGDRYSTLSIPIRLQKQSVQ